MLRASQLCSGSAALSTLVCLRQLVKVGPDVTGVGSAERADLDIFDLGFASRTQNATTSIELKQTMAPVVLLAALP